MASRNSRSRTQTRPISSGVWFSLFLVFGIILWFFWRLPLVPFLWLGMLAGGITQQYPVNASGSRKDPPSDKQMMVYHRWKDMLAGLMPNADWLEIRRVSWWMGCRHAIGIERCRLDCPGGWPVRFHARPRLVALQESAR